MSVYSDLILSLNPARYGRCDELMSGVLTDSSAFAAHGTTEPLAVFGLPSAIETDSGSSSIGGPVGTFPSNDEAELPGNFTWLFWIFYDAAFPSGTGISRRGQFGITNSIHAGINEDNIFAGIVLENGGSGDAFQLVANIALVDQTWYFVAVVRNGTTFLLYVNASLALGNFRSDLTGANVDYPVGVPWYIGRSVNTTAFAATRMDEVALFNYALTEANIIAVDAAARNSLFLHGYSNVMPSAVWISGAESPPIHYPFRHNFEEPLLERISFLTNNSKTLGGSVESSEMRIAPRREVEINHLVRSDEERRELRAKIWAHQHRPWFVPIRQDFEQLSANLASGAQTLPTVTQYKDYEVDSWLGLRELDDQGRIIKSEVLQIDALNPNDVHTATATVNSYSPFLSYIYPVRRGIISRSFSIKGHTDAVEELILVFELLAQDEAVIPNRIVPWTPTIVYKGYEAHDPAFWQSHNWIDGREYEIDRALSRVDFETGIFEVDSDTPGAEEAFEYRMLLKGRDKIAQFLGWFYSRGGSLSYLWVPSMQKDFSPTAVVSTEVKVEGTNYSENFALAEARRNLAFVYHDNTMVLRTVTAFAGSPNEELTLSPSPPTLVNLRSLSLLKFCQMESDSVELAWVTDDLIQVAWRFKELLSTPT